MRMKERRPIMETIIYDLNHVERDIFGNYGGKSGFKYGVIIDGERWMIKFPENTREFPGRDKKNNHVPSYTTSPLSEYIGSHIYEILGIPVHETKLGLRNGKIVVACKDFDVNHELVDYEKIKNGFAEFEDKLIGSSGTSSIMRGEFLDDVITVIEQSELLQKAEGIKERFWDMFVVDGFIRNNDRNNGNWGVFIKKDQSVVLAPVFDNGNSFFNKRNPSVSQRRILDEASIVQDALGTGVSYFLDKEKNHIHPFDFIERQENKDCTAALIRFSERIDMDAIRKCILDIPEKAFGVDVIAPEQKQHYIRMMEIIIERSINPTLEKLNHAPIDL